MDKVTSWLHCYGRFLNLYTGCQHKGWVHLISRAKPDEDRIPTTARGRDNHQYRHGNEILSRQEGCCGPWGHFPTKKLAPLWSTTPTSRGPWSSSECWPAHSWQPGQEKQEWREVSVLWPQVLSRREGAIHCIYVYTIVECLHLTLLKWRR